MRAGFDCKPCENDGMFTGIITGVGRIADVHALGNSPTHGKRLTIACPPLYLDDVGFGFVREDELEPTVAQPFANLGQFQVDDVLEVVGGQVAEDDHVVQSPTNRIGHHVQRLPQSYMANPACVCGLLAISDVSENP